MTSGDQYADRRDARERAFLRDFAAISTQRRSRTADTTRTGVALALRDALLTRDNDAICAITSSVAPSDAYLSALALLRTQIRLVGELEVSRLIAGRSLHIPVADAALEGHLKLLACLDELQTTPVGCTLAPSQLADNLVATIYLPLNTSLAFISQPVAPVPDRPQVMAAVALSIAVMHYITEQYGITIDEQTQLAHQALTIAVGAVPITR